MGANRLEPVRIGSEPCPGLIVEDSYWRWPERNLAGNAIDFQVLVLGLSFQLQTSPDKWGP